MGEQSTLEEFLDFSHENFQADEYALIMWNHGGGPMRGLCWDTAWAKDDLSMKEFTWALKNSPFAKEKLAWIGFDACLMSSIETAHLVTPYADYMIASEETEPCVGWSYDFLAGIEKDSDGKETGQRIVDSFMAAGEAANKASDKEAALTLACMDLSRTGDVEDKLNSFFKTLSKSLSPETFSELSNLREATREFGKAMSDSQRYDLVDLGDLIGNYAEHAPEEAEAFTQALQEMVVYSKSSLEGCSGLSSYHPYYNKTYYEKLWRKEYDSFAFAPYYRDYINNFATIWLGDAMGDWTQMNQVQYAGVEGETQYFSVQLTPEQVQYYASSNLLVLTEPYDGEYSQVFKTNKVTIDENGVLTAGYNGRTLYAVDENGTIVAGPLKYYISDDGHLEIIMMYENFESGAEQLYTHVIYECADAPAGSNLPVLEQYVYDEIAFYDVAYSRYRPLPGPIRELAIKFYKNKTNLKGVEGQELYYNKSKEILNSFYGMMAQDPGKVDILYSQINGFTLGEEITPEDFKKKMYNAFLSYCWAPWVTAWARFELHIARKMCGRRFVYCDTDSVKFTADPSLPWPLPDFTEYNQHKIELAEKSGSWADDPAGERHYMGVYEYEGSCRFKTLGAKKYCIETDGKLKLTCAGVGKRSGAADLSENGGINAFRIAYTLGLSKDYEWALSHASDIMRRLK